MAYLNRATLIGNIGKDPEIKTLQNGRKFVSFSLATSKRYRDNNGEQKEETQWHNIVIWGKTAETFENIGIVKGTQLYIEGEITNRSWTDQTTGQKRYTTEINASTFQILSSRNTQGTFGNGAASKSPTSCDIYEQAGNPLTRESETRGPQTDNNSEAVKALADGDIREDSQEEPDGSAITRNETRAHDSLEPSANIYATRQAKNGDAATREGAEAFTSRESGATEPTTVSRNMRRVPQNEAPAHGFSGG